MNQFQFPQITPKKVLLSIGGIFVAAVVFTVVSSFMPGSSLSVMNAPMMFSADENSSAGGYQIAMNESAYTMRADSSGVSFAPSSYMPSPAPSTPPAGVAKIVKSGNLSLLVEDIDKAVLAINTLRSTLLGQQGNASFSEYGNGGKRGDITIWVPSEKFDSAMVSIKALALRVNNEQVNVEDVSAQYVDLESRLRNLKAAETQYQEIMKRSGKISEVLEVTRALNETRAQIEQSQGQMDYLSRQVALSSIHISLEQEAIPGSVVTNEWRPLSVAKAALKTAVSDLTDLADLLIVFFVRLPVMLLYIAFWIGVFFGLWKLVRFLYRKMTSSNASVPSKDVV